MAIKVVLTDDHPLVREGVKSMLSKHQDVQVVGQFDSGKQLLEGLRTIRPDVILLDLQLSDSGGDVLIPTIKENYPDIKILVLTSNDNVHNVKIILNKGADGYLIKNTEQDLLVKAILDVHNSSGKTKILSPHLQESLDKAVHRSNTLPVRNNQLTPRELEVLQLIAKEYTSQEIGEQLHLSHRTVESYRLILMQKLDVKNMVGMVKKAILLGLIRE